MNDIISRRRFIKTAGGAFLLFPGNNTSPSVMTVSGMIPATAMGTTLVHEHFLVDFIGADKVDNTRWNKEDVVKKVLPYLLEVKQYGVKTIMDCTPAFLGRDVVLQKKLADASGLHILTNTGYYGAVENKYLPSWAFTESYQQLAQRWISEFTNGIENTAIKPGFIKISVDAKPLSQLHRKIVKAAALTHLQTGLTICSHTGIAVPAFEQIAVLQEMKVHPSAFIWTHAQAEADKTLHVKAATLGAWISLDGIGWGDFEKYADTIIYLKSAGLLNKVLISHDAGWYKPGESNEGGFTGYTNIFTKLVPLLKQRGMNDKDIVQLLVINPATAFTISIKKG